MHKKKRLFLFAAYSRDGVIEKSLVHYVRGLARIGDVVLCMDSNCKDFEPLTRFTVHFIAKRHGEYDFGSYKRAFIWARKNLNLDNYDFVYLVNDSVYGPVSSTNIGSILNRLERKGEFVGMVSNMDVGVPKHIQSWFIGVSNRIATSKIFKRFMLSIKKQNSKQEIVTKYEIGLSEMIMKSFRVAPCVLFNQDNHVCNTMYNKPYVPVKCGIPFIKKSAIQHMLSYRFLKKYVNNQKLYTAIKSTGVHVKYRPIKLVLASLRGF